MRLFLARHGQTAWNATSRAQGHSDIPLDETGLCQAECLADALRGTSIRRVITSDLKRAAATGQIVAEALGVSFQTDHRLRERSFGEMEGMSFNQLSATLHQQQAIEGVSSYRVRPGGGESLEDTFARIAPVASELCAGDQDTLVVGHGASCSLLLAHLIHGGIETSRAFRLANAGITELVRRPEGTFLIVRYNDVLHLKTGRPVLGSTDGASR